MSGGLRAAAALLLSAALAGCATHAPSRRPVGPDERTVAALEQRAERACRERGSPGGAPARPFRTDGCTLWPDGSWRACCVEHDLVYWCGGSRAERREADRRLGRCAAARVSGWRGSVLGGLLQAGTFAGGAPWLPTPWRWGFGHPFPSGYDRVPECVSEGAQGGR